MNQQNPTLKKAMLEALKKSLGIVSKACEIVGINRSTHYDWLKNDEEYKQEVENINEDAIDFAESKLFERMDGIQMAKFDNEGQLVPYTLPPDTTAIIFYLKTKGKKRGYVEKTEVDSNVSINKETFEIFGKTINFD